MAEKAPSHDVDRMTDHLPTTLFFMIRNIETLSKVGFSLLFSEFAPLPSSGSKTADSMAVSGGGGRRKTSKPKSAPKFSGL
jgi:hypothetical protein